MRELCTIENASWVTGVSVHRINTLIREGLLSYEIERERKYHQIIRRGDRYYDYTRYADVKVVSVDEVVKANKYYESKLSADSLLRTIQRDVRYIEHALRDYDESYNVERAIMNESEVVKMYTWEE